MENRLITRLPRTLDKWRGCKISSGILWYVYRKGKKEVLVWDGIEYGPHDEIGLYGDAFAIDGEPVFCTGRYKEGPWQVWHGTKLLVESDTEPRISNYCDRRLGYYVVFGWKNEQYVYVQGSIYGPFDGFRRIGGSCRIAIDPDENGVPCIVVQRDGHDYIVHGNKRWLGPFKEIRVNDLSRDNASLQVVAVTFEFGGNALMTMTGEILEAHHRIHRFGFGQSGVRWCEYEKTQHHWLKYGHRVYGPFDRLASYHIKEELDGLPIYQVRVGKCNRLMHGDRVVCEANGEIYFCVSQRGWETLALEDDSHVFRRDGVELHRFDFWSYLWSTSEGFGGYMHLGKDSFLLRKGELFGPLRKMEFAAFSRKRDPLLYLSKKLSDGWRLMRDEACVGGPYKVGRVDNLITVGDHYAFSSRTRKIECVHVDDVDYPLPPEWNVRKLMLSSSGRAVYVAGRRNKLVLYMDGNIISPVDRLLEDTDRQYREPSDDTPLQLYYRHGDEVRQLTVP